MLRMDEDQLQHQRLRLSFTPPSSLTINSHIEPAEFPVGIRIYAQDFRLASQL
jgi:hypothetical protein